MEPAGPGSDTHLDRATHGLGTTVKWVVVRREIYLIKKLIRFILSAMYIGMSKSMSDG